MPSPKPDAVFQRTDFFRLIRRESNSPEAGEHHGRAEGCRHQRTPHELCQYGGSGTLVLLLAPTVRCHRGHISDCMHCYLVSLASHPLPAVQDPDMQAALSSGDSTKEAQLLETWKAYKKGFQAGIALFNVKPKKGVAYLQVHVLLPD